MRPALSETVRRNPDLAWRELDGLIVAVTPADTKLHRLNECATLLFKEIGGKGCGLERLAKALEKKYALGPEKAGNDVCAFVDKAIKRGLLLPG